MMADSVNSVISRKGVVYACQDTLFKPKDKTTRIL